MTIRLQNAFREGAWGDFSSPLYTYTPSDFYTKLQKDTSSSPIGSCLFTHKEETTGILCKKTSQSFLEGTKSIPAFSLGGIGRTSSSIAMSFGGSVRGTGKEPPRSRVEQEDTRSDPIASIVSFCFMELKKGSLSFQNREKQRKPAMKGLREPVV